MPTTSGSDRCPYVPAMKDDAERAAFRDAMLAEWETLAKNGELRPVPPASKAEIAKSRAIARKNRGKS